MRIGIFDSGIGGLLIARAIVRALPQYDYVYLGDTQRVPYGNRSQATIYKFTREAVDYLFRKQNCNLIIIACNTASTSALRKIQREYLPNNFPQRRVLGVIRPTAEAASDIKLKRVGVLATNATVSSKAYIRELLKLDRNLKVFQTPAPLLVPVIEYGSDKWLKLMLREYLKLVLDKNIDVLVLGCTHYPIAKHQIRKMIANRIPVLSQDEIIPRKLKQYLERHPEIEKQLSRRRSCKLLVTDLTPEIERLARRWFGRQINLKSVRYGHEV